MYRFEEYKQGGRYTVVQETTSASTTDETNDPKLLQYESSLNKFKDERDAIQKKTFTKWVNKHLVKASRRVDDLFEDLKDGHSLLSLLEVLSGEYLPREKGRMRFHQLQNVETVLNFLRSKNVKTVNIRPEDIVDGNPKLTLGLIWTIILHFQISDITFNQNNEVLTSREALLRWAQRTTQGYPGVKVRDFTSSWRDGLAFNAIIHRNRPDLIDWHSLSRHTVRENLENVFNVSERELGVTRLLDPEDVDTPHPDEKSLITYLSSLYNVFPEPATRNPFEDEKQRVIDEYRDLSSSLLLWLKQNVPRLQNRSFPDRIEEVKQLYQDNATFRSIEIPPRLSEKQRLQSLWRDMQKMMRENRVQMDDQLRYDYLDTQWKKMLHAHEDRDRALQDEIARLEKLERLAEKVQREVRTTDGKLDDIEARIREVEKDLPRLRPEDAKRTCEVFERDLRRIEETIRVLFKDVQVLMDGRYYRSRELHRLVQNLQQKWDNVRISYERRLIDALNNRQYKVEEKKVVKERQVFSEARLLESNDAFKFLQQCLEWVKEKMKYLEEAEYGNDLPSIQSLASEHKTEQKLIDQFQKNIDTCVTRKKHFQGQELDFYSRLLAQLERGYSDVVVQSNKRMSDLDTLLEFVKRVHEEMMWLNEREEIEISRDWAAANINLVEVEAHQTSLCHQMEGRESQFNSVLDQGNSLIRQRHPAHKTIDHFLSAMHSSWSWMVELIHALQIHLRHTQDHQRFFREAKECEQWMQTIEERLNTTFSRTVFSIDEGERLLKQMNDMREDISRYSSIVNSLIDRSKDIYPLKQRRQPLPRPLRVNAVCNYSQGNMHIYKNEQCWLHDNNQRQRWKIINQKGAEGLVPGVVFAIPPPNPEAIDLAESLKRKYEALIKLWTKKQHKLRLNMIFATINIVKGWDLKTFKAMEPSQRESIIRALNDDADKLLAEGDKNDPDMKRLRDEIKYINKLYQDLLRQLKEEEAENSPNSPARRFQETSNNLDQVLREKERILIQRLNDPIPRDLDALDELHSQHKDFERELGGYESMIAEMKVAFKQMTKKTPTHQDKHDRIVALWDKLWTLCRVYAERFKAVELAISSLKEATQAVSNVEISLASYENLPQDEEALRKIHEDLLAIQLEMQQQQPLFDQLVSNVTLAKKVTEKSRPSVYTHPDLRKLDDDTKRVLKRWSDALNQIAERLRSCEAASEMLRAYRSKMDDERQWANQMTIKVNTIKEVKSSRDAEREYQQALSLFTTLTERKPILEELNLVGGRYIREAKIYDLRNKNYRESLEDAHPSLDASLKQRRGLPGGNGADLVETELDQANAEYRQIGERLSSLLHSMQKYFTSEERHKQKDSERDSEQLLRGAPGVPPIPSIVTYQQQWQSPSTSSAPSPIEYSAASTTSEMELGESTLRGSSLTITEVKSTKLIKTHEDNPNADFLARTALKDTKSDQRVPLCVALRCGIIDAKSGKFVDTKSGRQLAAGEALESGLVSQQYLDVLEARCGLVDTKTQQELTLLDAIRLNVYDPHKQTLLDSKGNPISVEKAAQSGLLRDPELMVKKLKLIRVTRLSITEAFDAGLLNPKDSRVTDPMTGESYSIDEAFDRKLIEPKRENDEGLTLTYAIDRGMVDDKGRLTDNCSGGVYDLNEALTRGVLCSETREVVNKKSGKVVSVPTAIREGVISVRNGQYVDEQTRERLSLGGARRRGLISPSLTLKDAESQDLLDESGTILNPYSNKRISLLEAVSLGLLDANIKCILHPISQEAMSLTEAMQQGIITPDGKFVNPRTHETMSIVEAVHRGLISSVSQKMIFEVEGFQDTKTGENISFNQAVQQGVINLKSRTFKDTKTNRTMPLREALSKKLVLDQVYEMLTKPIGLKDDTNGQEITLLEAVFSRRVDHKTGQLRHPKSMMPISLRDGVKEGIITPEGAALLRGLLRITVSTATVTKTITRYVTVQSKAGSAEVGISFQEAVRKGLINEHNATFKHPKSGKVVSLEEAINDGLLVLSADSTRDLKAVQAILNTKTKTRVVTTEREMREVIEKSRSRSSSPMKPHQVRAESKIEVSPSESSVKTSLGGTGASKEMSYECVYEESRLGASASQAKMATVEAGSEAVSRKISVKVDTKDSKRESEKPSAEKRSPSPSKPGSPEHKKSKRAEAELSSKKKLEAGTTFTSELRSTQTRESSSSSTKSSATSRSGSPQKTVETSTHVMTSASTSSSAKTKTKDSAPAEGSRAFSPTKSPGRTGSASATHVDSRRESKSRSSSPSKKSPSSSGPQQASPDATSTVVFDIPSKGWNLKEVLHRDILDAGSGLLTLPGTDRAVTLEETVKLQLINPESARVTDTRTGKKCNLLEAFQKGLLDSTGGTKMMVSNVPLRQALDSEIIELLEPAAPESEPRKQVHIARPVHEEPAEALEKMKPFTTPTPLTIVRHPETGLDIDLGTAVEAGVISTSDVVISDLRSGESFTLERAAKQGIVDEDSLVFTDQKTQKKMGLSDAIKLGLIAVSAPAALGLEAIKDISQLKRAREERLQQSVTCTEPVRATTETTKIVRKAELVIRDAQSGREIPVDEALQMGIIDSGLAKELRDSAKTTEHTVHTTTTVLVTDPKTGQAMTLTDALQKGVLTKDAVEKLQRGNVSGVLTSVQTAFVGEDKGATVSYQEFMTRPMSELTKTAGETKLTIKPSEALSKCITRAEESITVGRQPVLLQRIRRILYPADVALQRGYVDAATRDVLDEVVQKKDQLGPMTLSEAIRKGLVQDTEITDPLSGQKIRLSECTEKKLIDDRTGLLAIPVGRPLALGEALQQGVIDTKRDEIVHPETGANLSLQEGILCDIVDYNSAVLHPDDSSKQLSVDEAISQGLLDKVTGEFSGAKVKLPLHRAAEKLAPSELSEKVTPQTAKKMPKLALTFPVALERGLIDTERKEFTHPATGSTISVREAISKGLLLDQQIAVAEDSFDVVQALEGQLIDSARLSVKHPKTGSESPVRDAMESGSLQLKPVPARPVMSSSSSKVTSSKITAKVTTIRKTLSISPGYEMASKDSVRERATGKVYPLDEAIALGFVKVEAESKDTKQTLSDAVACGAVDLEKGVFTDQLTGQSMPLREALAKEVLVLDRQPKGSAKYGLADLFDYFDADSKKFQLPDQPRALSLGEIGRLGLLDESAFVYLPEGGSKLSVGEFIKDPRNSALLEQGKLNVAGRTIDVQLALKKGLLATVAAPAVAAYKIAQSTSTAIRKGTSAERSSSPTKATHYTHMSKREQESSTSTKSVVSSSSSSSSRKSSRSTSPEKRTVSVHEVTEVTTVVKSGSPKHQTIEVTRSVGPSAKVSPKDEPAVSRSSTTSAAAAAAAPAASATTISRSASPKKTVKTVVQETTEVAAARKAPPVSEATKTSGTSSLSKTTSERSAAKDSKQERSPSPKKTALSETTSRSSSETRQLSSATKSSAMESSGVVRSSSSSPVKEEFSSRTVETTHESFSSTLPPTSGTPTATPTVVSSSSVSEQKSSSRSASPTKSVRKEVREESSTEVIGGTSSKSAEVRSSSSYSEVSSSSRSRSTSPSKRVTYEEHVTEIHSSTPPSSKVVSESKSHRKSSSSSSSSSVSSPSRKVSSERKTDIESEVSARSSSRVVSEERSSEVATQRSTSPPKRVEEQKTSKVVTSRTSSPSKRVAAEERTEAKTRSPSPSKKVVQSETSEARVSEVQKSHRSSGEQTTEVRSKETFSASSSRSGSPSKKKSTEGKTEIPISTSPTRQSVERESVFERLSSSKSSEKQALLKTEATHMIKKLPAPGRETTEEQRTETIERLSSPRAAASGKLTESSKSSSSESKSHSSRFESPSSRVVEEESFESIVERRERSQSPSKRSTERSSSRARSSAQQTSTSSYVSEVRQTSSSSSKTSSRSVSPSKVTEATSTKTSSRSSSPSKMQVVVKESSRLSSPVRQVAVASASELDSPQWQNVRESSSFTDTEVVVKQMFTEYEKHFEGEMVVGSKLTVEKIMASDVLAAKHFMVRIPSTGVTMKLEDALMLNKVSSKSKILVRSLNELVLIEQDDETEDSEFQSAMIEQESRLESSSKLKREFYDSHKHIFVKPGGSQQIDFEQFVETSNLNNIRVKDMKSNEFVSLREAFDRGIIDRSTGEFFDHSSGASMSFFDAADLSFVTWSTASSERQGSRFSSTRGVTSEFQSLSEAIRGLSFDQEKAAMQERYRVADESLTNLASWLSEVETRIASLGALHEEVNRLSHQQAVAKTVKEELEINRKVVNQTLDQVRQISKEGSEMLSTSEISNLQRSAENVKSRYDSCNINADKLLRRIDTALEELQKFSSETRTFVEWLKSAQRTLLEYEKYLANVSNLKDNMEQFRQFSTDVITHQADLRFLTMAAQKFMDESKTYLRQLNEIRTAHPDRLGHIEAHESEVKSQVNEITSEYQTLLNRVNKLSDQLGGLGERKRNYREAVEKATVWLNDAQKQAKKLLEEPTGAEPRQIQDQLDRVRAFNMDIIQQGRLIDGARHAGEALIDMLPAGSSEKGQIQDTIKNLQDVYQQMVTLIGDKTNELQMALVHSQDIEDGLNRLLKWMDDVESQIKIQSRPASLIRERLDEQIHEHRVLTQEIESQRSVLEAMTKTAQQARLAKKVEQKLRDMHSRYEKVLDKLRKNGQVLDDVSHQLDQFNSQCGRFEDWLSQLVDAIEEAGAARSAEEVQARLEDVIRRKNQKKGDFEEVMRAGRELTGRRDVTDTSIIKDRLRQLEQLWKEMDIRLTEQERANRQRMEQLSAYETLRVKVFEWLASMETKIDRLEPVSLDKDAIRRQAMEIKPLVKEHADYRPTIDKVNELGRIYESLISEERAGSRMSLKSSPTRSEYNNKVGGHQNGHSNGHHGPQSDATSDDTVDAASIALTKPQHSAKPAVHASLNKAETAMPEVRSPLAETSGSTSGFSSRQSSVDQFASIELDVSPVQQQLSEINHRYQIIGVKLSDRQRDLDGLADEVKRHHDTIKSLLTFVQTKERQMPKEVSPASKELADKQYASLKEIQADLADRQNEMDRVKIEVTDLLRRKPNAIGADSLQQSLQELVQKWSALQALIRDQMSLLNDFRDFQDTHRLLDNWLSQKDKMFQVLGPIAHEPRMITAQMQQVHVMRDEFTSQEPLMRRMNQSGNEICSKLGPANPAARKVKDGMEDIRKRWDELLGRLQDRERNLDAATGATQEFHTAINKLQDALQNISDNFDRLADDADIQEQLRRLTGLEDDLERQRPLLAEVESMCDHLCDILSDPASKSEIKSKYAAADRLYNNLNRKLSNRRAELENSLKEDRDFLQSVKDVQDWFDEIDHKLSSDFRISADEHILRQQIERYEPVYREVLDKEHEVHILLTKGNDIILKMGRTKPEAQQVKAKMDGMKKSWEKIKREATERHTRLQTAMENCKRFYSALNKFGPWLQGTEARFSELKPPSYQKAELDKQIREIQTFKNEMSRHAIDFDNVRSIGDTFLACTDVDKEKVREELENLQRRWELLSQAIMNRAQDLDEIAARIGEFNDKARDVGHTLQRMEDRALSHDDGARDARTLDKMKALLREAHEFHKDLDRLRAYGDSLVNAAPIGCDTRPISDTMDELERRHRELTNKLEDKCHELDAAAGVLAQFNNRIKNIQTNFGHLDDEFNEFAPIGRDLRTLNVQKSEIRSFKDKLHRAAEELEEAEREAREIVAQGYSQDAKGLRAQLDNLRKQLLRLSEKANKRESGIDAMIGKLQKFYDDLGDVSRSLGEAATEERNFRPVAADVETIRQQQEEFKHFRRNFVEPLGKAIEEMNRQGQGLIQSAPAGVNTGQLEHDIEKLNSEWNQLKEKVNERERTLDAALLHSGKFQEALASVEKWLQETEEMVANQKPPSADYKVVKAQLQEQKFLIRLIQDRQSNIVSLMRMGEDVMKNVAPGERSSIQHTLEDIRERFDKLQTGAKQRMDALERTLPVAKAFQEKMAPLVDWLDHAEKKLSAMQTIPTDANRAAQRAQDHGNLHQDILDHKRDFEELTEIAQTLMGLVGDEEAQTVVDSLRELTDRYARLVEESERLEDMLQNVKEGIKVFSENYEDLLGWMSEMERRLQRYQILSVYPEKLQQQLEELTELGEDIADHQRQVDEVVSAGQSLMRYATGDDAFNLKDRLDNLQARYNDLASKAAERVRQAQEALPIAQNFHQNHEKVSGWIDEADAVLKSIENAGLNAQETAVHRLELDIPQVRNILEVVNHLGPQLCQLSPGEGASNIESMMTRLNRRFDAICEQIQRKAERIELSKQRNSEVIGDLDELNDWFRDLEKQLQHAEPIVPDRDALRAMLKEHKVICEEVSSQKGRVRDLLAAAKKLMRESTGEDQSLIRDKAESLKDISNRVSQLCADRLSALEQALPLAEHFFDTHEELVQWLEVMETEAELLGAPALNPVQIKKQQDKNKALLQSMNDHKPLLDKLNKTGAALIKLVPMEEGRTVQYIMNQDNQRYNDLRNLLKTQQQALEEAMQSTAQFADKLDGMLNALANTADQLNNAEPISAHVEKIHEQISDNNAIVDDLEKKSSALDAVRKAAKDVISKADGDEPAVRDIKKKLSKLNDLWDEIQGLASKRGRSLNDALAAAERFWDELNAVMRALKELQDNINGQEPPAVEPSAIQQQQDVLQEIREEMDNTKPEVDQCKQAGSDLMRLCGEPDKPEVKKHIEDLDQAWQNVMTLYAKREQSLADALSKAMGFHNTLQDLLEFLDSAEDRFGKLGPIASEIGTVKHQIADLKDFKADVDPHMVQVEALNRQAKELTERTTPDQARPIREALKEINKRWAALNKGIVDRQKELENALLRLGQFQHALNELLSWISKTDRQLDDVKIVVGDPQVIEVELAKHKVLMNDIQAHQSTVDSINKAGHQLIELDRSSRDAGETQSKLANLNARWQALQDKANDKQRQLEAALREAQLFSQEIQDLLMWLSDVDQQLASSKPVGGLPETAREQLNRFMELYNEIDSNRHKVENTLSQGQEFIRRSDGSATNLQHSLKTLKSRWDSVLQKANDRKIKLEIALREATEFHEALQQFVDWLTDSEKYLSNLKPVSRLLPSVLEQIEEHKNFQKDVSAHREVMLNLDKKGTHLKYFSQKQDVILIKNLLVSVQHRWERVVSKAAERTRALDHGYKEAKEFHDSYEALDKWLSEAEHTIEDLANVGNDPDRIKRTLSKHKEFQRALAGKQATYDATMRAGRLLKDKAPKQDVPTLQKMLDDLKEKWNRVCAKAVDKQRKLEEALLFSGQFKDAVQALIDWLDKSVPTLDPNEKVHGDLDTVNNLIEQHKQFQADLKNRQANLESVRKTSRELLRTASAEDAANIRQQMSDLESKWENVMGLSNQKQRRLDDALRQAEQLHKSVHMLLEWLSDAEMKLRFAGPLPDDEATCRQQIAEHQRFMKEMDQQEHNKEKTIALAHEILQKCHPDAVSVIRHWITIIQSRWDEVSQWARQRLQKLEDHLRGLRDILDLLEELMRWLLGAEATLTALEAQPLPDDIPATEQLIDDHKIFMDDMSRKQPDVDRIAKAFTTKTAPQAAGKALPAGRSSRAGPAGRSATPGRAATPTKGQVDAPGTITNPRARELMDKWQSVWLMALERQKRLQDHLKYLRELEGIRNFDFDEWRRRFLGWLNSKKMRAMDAFRKIDKDNDGKVTKQDFIDGIIDSRFPTTRLEMERVADIFDRNGDGYVDHKEYIDTLRPDRDNRPLTEAEKIQDEVQRQVAKCTCVHRFKVFQVGEGKYRFGESQKLRLVRILRSTVMVRVGGGWVALDEFLVKNDPCRAKGRTNVELREQFILADGVSQSMAAFKSKGPGASSFGKGPGGLPTQGPITKVREKTEKSIPLSTQRKLAAESESERSTPLGSRPRTSQSRLTPSLGGSRPSSRPASRANSDLSTESLEGFRRRTPSASSGTRIPTRRTPSMTRQKSDLQAREKGWR